MIAPVEKNISRTGPLHRRSLGYARDSKGKVLPSAKIGFVAERKQQALHSGRDDKGDGGGSIRTGAT
jgi:hypothetical protein